MGDPAKLITSWSELPYDPQVQSMLADSNNVVPSLQFQSNFQATSPLVSENHKDAPLGGAAAAVPSLSAPPAAVPKGFDASRVTRRGAGAHLRRFVLPIIHHNMSIGAWCLFCHFGTFCLRRRRSAHFA
jgi:hypothetical protein